MKKEKKKKKFTNAVNLLINHFPPICRKSFSPHFFKTFFNAALAFVIVDAVVVVIGILDELGLWKKYNFF